MARRKAETSCPCGSGREFAVCCQPCINGDAPAPTVEALMRSRYTAYAMQNTRYLLETWHASTRPASLELDSSTQWIRLKILDSSADRVEFVATCRINGKAHRLQENSRFVHEHGRWYYVDGQVEESQ